MSSEQEKVKLQCYNRSCGQMFDPNENTPESCLHHPGVPVFHDVYKKWSCCDKKTTDFTEFLNIKGCQRSYHSNIKPPEAPKPTNGDIREKNEIIYKPPPMQQSQEIERPDSNTPMVQLPFSIGASLKPMLDKMLNEKVIEADTENDLVVKVNTPCQNSGCSKVYKGEYSNDETCYYHPGVPVFHEGLKYWSCCVKRTTDFNSFLEQIGCTSGKHKWHKDKNKENKANCRYDWHQTGNTVVVSVFSKCPLPELSFVKANPVKIYMHIVFGQEKHIFDKEIILSGVIDVTSCSVTYLGSKVEIKMKKSPAVSWKDLALQENISDVKSTNQQEQ